MTIAGDRLSAGLLSVLAEAPDSAAASSFLVAQLAELSGADHISMLRVDPAQEALISIARIEPGREPSPVAIQLSNLGDPLVLAALSLTPIASERALPGDFP